MATINKLTPGSLAKMLAGEFVDKARLQIINYKAMNPQGNGPKYRFSMSDGITACNYCVIGGDLVAKIERGEFERFTIIQVNKYAVNNVKGADGQMRSVLVVTEAEVLEKGFQIGEKIVATPQVKKEPDSTSLPRDSRLNPNFQNIQITSTSSMNPFSNYARPTSTSKPKPEDNISLFSIESLNPYINRWAIRGRVTSKSSIRTWSNAKGEGKLFSFNLQDETGEIRVTAFKAECDKFYDLIEVDKVYTVNRGILKPANKQYSSLPHDYEVTLTAESMIEQCDENTAHCPKISYDFVKIKDVAKVEPDSVVDIIGVCKSIGDITLLTQKSTGKELKKRDISLVDDSETEISFTLWGEEAEKFQGHEGSAVIAKRAKVSAFSGRSLSSGFSTSIQVDPPIEHAFGLKGWYESHKNNLNITSLTNNEIGGKVEFKPLVDLSSSSVSANNNSLILTSDCYIVQAGRLQVYQSCTSQGCKKKLINMNNGYYRCEKCNKDTSDYMPRLIFNICVADYTAEKWLTAFNEEAEMILGATSKEIDNQCRNSDQDGLWDESKLQDFANKANFKHFYLKIKAKMENYKEDLRLRGQILNATKPDPIEHCRLILQLLSSMDTV